MGSHVVLIGRRSNLSLSRQKRTGLAVQISTAGESADDVGGPVERGDGRFTVAGGEDCERMPFYNDFGRHYDIRGAPIDVIEAGPAAVRHPGPRKRRVAASGLPKRPTSPGQAAECPAITGTPAFGGTVAT